MGGSGQREDQGMLPEMVSYTQKTRNCSDIPLSEVVAKEATL